MQEFKVYKNLRRKATIFGMPVINFWAFIIASMCFILILTTGLTLVKLVIVLVGIGIAYLLCRFAFNKEMESNMKINDYKRN